MIPLDVLTSQETIKMKRTDDDWTRLVMSTGMSTFLSPENHALAVKNEKED